MVVDIYMLSTDFQILYKGLLVLVKHLFFWGGQKKAFIFVFSCSIYEIIILAVSFPILGIMFFL